MNYQQVASKQRSEKITLVTIESNKLVKLFSLFSGSVYVRDVGFWVCAVSDSGTAYTQAYSTSLSAGQWYFNPIEKKLYVRSSDSSNPKTRSITITHRHFYSNSPIILPNDLTLSGVEVEWDSRIDSIGSLGQQLDDQSTGVVLESSSSVSMINNDGYWDEIYDTLIWENRPIKFYSYLVGTQVTESKKIFDGLIESKDFSTTFVKFNVRDFVFKLQNLVDLGEFSASDGYISPSAIGLPKRRIYGQVDKIKCTGIDKTLDGFIITGSISGDTDSSTITGTGTNFLKELSPSDQITITISNTTYKIDVESVESDTSFTAGSELKVTFSSASGAVNKPNIPYRFRNRLFHVAGHKLRSPVATVTEVVSSNRFNVDTSEDIFSGDQVDINGDLVTVRRISGNQIVTENAISPIPVVSDTISKLPVQRAYYGSNELIYGRDWSLSNTSEAKIILDSLAEFNFSAQRSMSTSFTFTNGSRDITTSASVDLRSVLSSRDWIRKNSLTETSWYEILEVKEQSVIIRSPFSGTTQTTTSIIKNVKYIDDDTVFTVDCLGMEDGSGLWLKTPSDAVRHLVLNDAGFPSVNEQSFDKAKSDSRFILSLAIPDTELGSSPKIKDVITKINESAFGSLYGNSSFDVSYGILNSIKPELTQVLKDDDIISFDVKSNQKIVNKVKVNYSPFVDIFTGEDGFKSIIFESEFVNDNVGINNTLEVTIYLYEDDKAEIIAQRLALFNSLSTTTVSIKGKMSLALNSVNDKLFLSLDRLYKRFGGADRRKIGVITGIKKNGFDVDVDITDLSNIYNRVPSIAPNTTPEYSSGSRDDFVRYGYVLDNSTLTPDNSSEEQLGNGIIG